MGNFLWGSGELMQRESDGSTRLRFGPIRQLLDVPRS